MKNSSKLYFSLLITLVILIRYETIGYEDGVLKQALRLKGDDENGRFDLLNDK